MRSLPTKGALDLCKLHVRPTLLQGPQRAQLSVSTADSLPAETPGVLSPRSCLLSRLRVSSKCHLLGDAFPDHPHATVTPLPTRPTCFSAPLAFSVLPYLTFFTFCLFLYFAYCMSPALAVEWELHEDMEMSTPPEQKPAYSKPSTKVMI